MKSLKIFVAVFLCILLVRETSGQQSITKIAFIGNSITEGTGLANPRTQAYPAQLANLLTPDWQVGNFGVSGRTMLKKGDFPIWNEQKFKDALAFAPNIVVIMLGTNDSKYYNWAYKADFYKDYVSMIDTFSSLPSKPKIYICYPLKVFKKLYDIDDLVIHDEIIPIVHQISIDKNLPIVDMYTPTSDKPEIFSDGIHPNASGAHFVAEIFYKELTGNTYRKMFDENLLPWKKFQSSGLLGEGYLSNAAGNAIDGDLISAWSFKGFPATLTVDIGTIQSVDQFELFFRSDKDKGIQYKIESSTDSLNWNTIVDQSQRADVLSAYSLDKIQATDARYIRLSVIGTSTGTTEIIRINEFKALKHHGTFHAPFINADIPSTLSSALNLIPAENMQNMNVLKYNTLSKAFDVVTTIKDFTTPYAYKFKATMNNQYVYMTSAYSNGVEVFSDTIKLKFVNLTYVPNLSRTNDNHFQVFPNPSADHIRIVAKQQINEKVTVNILGIKGELIETFHSEGVLFKNQELVSKTTNSSKNKLIPGIYFINIDGPTIHENMKVVVN
jgi:lysophospholipase L1-like esterase